MVTILVATIVVFGLGAVFGIGLRWLVENQTWMRLGVFVFLLSLTFVPFYQSYQVRSQEVRGWRDGVKERLGEEGLTRLNSALSGYQWTTLVGGAVLFLLALGATKVHPTLSAYLPGVSFVLYFLVSLGQLQENLPQDVALDNVPTIWLFVLCGGVQTLLIGYVWKGWNHELAGGRNA
jgi:hypothetical protein